jgi:hypothetical protein
MDRCAEGPHSSRNTSFEERLAVRDLRIAALKAPGWDAGKQSARAEVRTRGIGRRAKVKRERSAPVE